MTVQDAYQACYDQIAREHVEYARANNGGNPFIEPALVETLESATEAIVRRYVTPGKRRILDAGCGPGSLLDRLRDYYACEGIDLSADYVEYAKSRYDYEWAIFRVGSLEHLPYPNNTFDAVICADVLEHVLDEHAVLRELIRVLKPGGHLIIRVPFEKDLSAYLDTEYEYVHLRRFGTIDLLFLLGKIHGLTVQEVSPLVYPAEGEPAWMELHAVAVKP